MPTHNKSKKIFMFLLAFSLAFLQMAGIGIKSQAAEPTESDLQKQISDKKASLTASASKRKDLESQIASFKNQQANAIRDKKGYDDLIGVIEAEIKDTEDLISMLDELIEESENEIAQAEQDYEKNYAIFLNIIQFAYEEGDVNYLSLLVNSEDFTDFLSRVDIISNVLEYNKIVIDNLKSSKKNLTDKKGFHEEMKTQQKKHAEEITEKLRETEQLRSDAEKTIAKLSGDIASSEAAQAQWLQEEANIQAEISRATKELQAKQETPRKYIGGSFLYPVTPKYSNPVSSGFGYRKSPITGRREFHNGIDIPANHKAPIWAVNDGIVIVATYSSGYGNYIVIDHGSGKQTLYAHASSLAKKVNDKVTKGDVIAYVGSTGWSTGYHLHFSYMEYGEYKDPLTSGLLDK